MLACAQCGVVGNGKRRRGRPPRCSFNLLCAMEDLTERLKAIDEKLAQVKDYL